jgi:hypothetical protein
MTFGVMTGGGEKVSGGGGASGSVSTCQGSI